MLVRKWNWKRYSGAVNAEENVTASATPYRIPKKSRNPALIAREKGSKVNINGGQRFIESLWEIGTSGSTPKRAKRSATVAEPAGRNTKSDNQADEIPVRSRHSHRETFVSPNREVLAPVQPQMSGGGGGSSGAGVVSIKMQTLAANAKLFDVNDMKLQT